MLLSCVAKCVFTCCILHRRCGRHLFVVYFVCAAFSIGPERRWRHRGNEDFGATLWRDLFSQIGRSRRSRYPCNSLSGTKSFPIARVDGWKGFHTLQGLWGIHSYILRHSLFAHVVLVTDEHHGLGFASARSMRTPGLRV